MTDNVSKETRQKTMRAVKAKHTKLEDKVIKELWKLGCRFCRNVENLSGKPDIAIKKYKLVIFIDSCFWHGCEFHCRMPSTNQDYWLKKIARNKERDTFISNYYKDNNWHILRIWEHEIKQDFNGTIRIIIDFINTCKK